MSETLLQKQKTTMWRFASGAALHLLISIQIVLSSKSTPSSQDLSKNDQNVFVNGRRVISSLPTPQNAESNFFEDVDFITPELYDQVSSLSLSLSFFTHIFQPYHSH